MNRTIAARPEPVALLQANTWLKNFPLDALQILAASGRFRRLSEGEVIAACNEKPEGIAVVVRGAIRNSNFSEDGREIVFSMVKPGNLWGLVAALDGAGSVHDTRASGDTELFMIPTHALLELLDARPALYRHLTQMLCYRLRKAYNAVEELGLASLRQRLARQLCTLSLSADLGPGPDASVSLTQEDLALMVGATRSSVNRELAAMEAEGLVHKCYGRVEVIDYERLHQLCITRRIFDL